MPIDGIKIICDPIENYGIGQDVKVSINETTGEIINREFVVNGLTFKEKRESRVLITGSLHTYYNKGKGNYNGFNFEDLQSVIREINQHYYIPLDSKLQNIEFGINIQLPFPVNKFLSTLLFYNGQPFNIIREKNFNYFQNSRTRFIIKIYDKSLQYNLNDNILRVEIKVTRMIHVSKLGITRLSDLTNKQKVISLTDTLIRDFNNIICCEPEIHISDKSDKEFILQGLNTNYWHNLKGRNYKQYEYRLSKFKKLVEKYNLNKRQKDVSNLLFREINTLYIPVNSLIRNTCLVTGLDISIQKEGSKFLNITGIRYLKSNNPEIYCQLKKRLSNRWNNSNERIKMREIAHSIRNEYFNKFHNNKRDIDNLLNKQRTQPFLFDQKNFIDRERMKYAKMVIN